MASASGVVILSDFAHVSGGAEKVALLSARGLAERGVSVAVLSAIGPVEPSLAARSDLKIKCLGQRPFYDSDDRIGALRGALWSAPSRDAMASMLDSFDPAATVVHVHSFLKCLSGSPVECAMSRGFRVVLTLHDYGIACPQQNFFDHRAAGLCARRPLGLQCLCRQCTPRSPAVKAGLVLRACLLRRAHLRERFSAFIAPASLSHRVLKAYLPPNTPVHVVRNPCEATPGPRVDCASNSAATYVGRLTPEKAPEHLARAARLAGVQAVFVGDGVSRAEVDRALPGATVTGWLDAPAVAARLDEARCVVAPSIWNEIGPLGIYDALARGLPTIVSDRCGAGEEIEHGVNGLRYPAGDVDALADALRRLQDASTAESLGRAAYERYWADPPTLDAHVDAILRVYDLALASPAPA